MAAEEARHVEVWEPYRDRFGRVFFSLRGGRGSSRWDPPAPGANVRVLGDGSRAVNDVASWERYEDAASGEQYFFNTVSRETSWREPPGCAGLPAVNVASSWLTFVSAARDGKRYYLNKVSKEVTWHRPRCLGRAAEGEPGHDREENAPRGAGAVIGAAVGQLGEDPENAPPVFVGAGGEEFVAPEGFDADLDFGDLSEGEEEKEEEVSDEDGRASALEFRHVEEDLISQQPKKPLPHELELDREREQEHEGSQSRESDLQLELEAQLAAEMAARQEDARHLSYAEAHALMMAESFDGPAVATVRRRFEELLDERGVQPHSQWANWAARLVSESDPRCADAPIEERARWFTRFARSLIGRNSEARTRRSARCLALLRELREGEAGAEILHSHPGAVQLLDALASLKTDPKTAVDKPLAMRVLHSLGALPAQERDDALRRSLLSHDD